MRLKPQLLIHPAKPRLGICVARQPQGNVSNYTDSMKMTPKTSLARGTRGFLLRSFDDTGCLRYFFRVYRADHSFHDYELIHSDLEIEIVDEEATFYDTENGRDARLDHSPRTLGREE